MVKVKKNNLAIIAISLFSSVSYASGVNPDLMVKGGRVFPELIIQKIGGKECPDGYRQMDIQDSRYWQDVIFNLIGSDSGSGRFATLLDGWYADIGRVDENGHPYPGFYRLPDNTLSQPICYPQSTEDMDIPIYDPVEVSNGKASDYDDVLWDIANNKDFYTRLMKLANVLGFEHTYGNQGKFPGEDVTVKHAEGDRFIIEGSHDGDCDGFRCDDKTALTVSNFNITMDGSGFDYSNKTQHDKELVNTIEMLVKNNSSIEQVMVVTLSMDETSSWSKSHSYGFSEGVSITSKFKIPLVGESGVTVSFEANQDWGETNGGQESKSATIQARINVPPHRQIPARLNLYVSDISYDYKFNGLIDYDVNFEGWMSTYNALPAHPTDYPTISHTFSIGKGGNTEHENSIPWQWNHRYNKDDIIWWDWSWLNEYQGLNYVRGLAGQVLRPSVAPILGVFDAEGGKVGAIEIGGDEPIDDTSLESTIQQDGDNIDFTSNFDATELSELGFKNATISVEESD